MSTTSVIIDPGAQPFDPSMADLEKLLSHESTAPVEEPKPETAEAPPAKTEEAKSPETDPAPVETKPEPDKDEPLPPAVQKRIDKEIAKAVSARKEAEAIAARLKEQETGKPGTDPAKSPQPAAQAKPARPARPVFGDKAEETWAEFKARETAYEGALDKYEGDLQAWISKTTAEEVERRTQAKTATEGHQKAWDAAVKEHGDTFPALVEELAAKTPEGLQTAISQLENWSTVAVHLARNPDKHEALVAKFKANPYQAIATLGRIEASLKTEPKPAAKKAEPLPAPPAKVGGGATASPAVDLNEGDFGSFAKSYKAILRRE